MEKKPIDWSNLTLAHIWIDSDKGLKDLNIDLGSKYEFKVTRKSHQQVMITKTLRENYVEDFYSQFNPSVSNISALIGENGTGKTSILMAVTEILSGNSFDRDMVCLFVDTISDQIFEIHSPEDRIFEGIKGLAIKADFDFNPLSIEKTSSDRIECIYHNPFYDFDVFPITHDSRDFRDISSSFLMIKDTTKVMGKGEGNQFALHKFKNDLRQLDFLSANKSWFRKVVGDEFWTPERVDISFTRLTSGDERNIPNSFRAPLKKLEELFLSNYGVEHEKIAIAKAKYRIDIRETQLELEKAYQGRALHHFIDMLLFNIKYYLNYSNAHLTKKITTIGADGLSYGSTEELMKGFWENQDFLDPIPIIELIDSFKQILPTLEEYFHETDEFRLPLTSANSFLIAYKKYLQYMSNVIGINNDFDVGFVDLSWKGLSSGQKNRLDLYSRLFDVANDLKKESKEPSPYYGELIQLPQSILVLLDEAELGYHLKWHKALINELVFEIPKLFKSDEWSPKIQFIIASHSPISLSDIPNDRVTLLDRKDNLSRVHFDNEKVKAFAGNIHEILSQDFFMGEGTMGDFSSHIVNTHIIDKILSDETTAEEFDRIKQLISYISDDVLKNWLTDLFNQNRQR